MADVYKYAMAFRKRLLSLDKKARGEILAVYKEVLRDIDPFVKDYYRRLQAGELAGIADIEKIKLIKRLEAEITDASSPIAQTVAESQGHALDIANAQAFGLAKLGDKSLKIGVNWRKPSLDAVQNLVGYAADGRPLDTYFKSKLPADAAKGIQKALFTSTLLNEPPKVAQKRIRSSVAGNAWKAETIARTEILRAHRETSRQNFLENDDVILGYQWLAARDSRSCVVCWMLSGKIFKSKDPFGSHVNCRCTLVPITDPADIQDIPPGSEEFKKLPEDEQKDVLGIPKWEAWQSGKLELNNLVGFKKHPVFGPVRWERGLKDSLKGGMPGAIPPQPKSLVKAPKKAKAPKPEEPITKPPETVAPSVPGLKAPVPVAPPLPAPPPPSRAKTDFPFEQEIEALKPVRSLGGSTGAELVQDAHGNLWVKKKGSSADHLRSEFAADQIYRAMGVAVPEARLYELPGGPVKLARFIEGTPLNQLRDAARDKAVKQVREDFAVDALLANWDVTGQDADNILVDKNGKAWRIDNGGALRYRAQGALKTTFDSYPLELWTMRKSEFNPRMFRSTAEAFGTLSIFDVRKQLERISKLDPEFKKSFPVDVKQALEGRLKEFDNLRGHLELLEGDKWRGEYSDQVAYHVVNLRRSSVIDKLPEELRHDPSKAGQGWSQHAMRTVVWDKNGKAFDHLRDEVIDAVGQYYSGAGLNYKTIETWMGGQAHSSWSVQSYAFKYFLNKVARESGKFYWNKGEGHALVEYDHAIRAAGGADVYMKAHAAYKALMMEFLQKTEFENNDKRKRELKLIRTEQAKLLKKFKIKVGEKGKMERGTAESFSIFEKYFYTGNAVTTQTLSHVRIHGIYFFARSPSQRISGFAGDSENEINAMYTDEEVFYESDRP